jgi:hypothetical protein
MKKFKYFILESYKLPAIQTVFGARSIEDRQESIKKKEREVSASRGEEFQAEPVLSDGIMKEEVVGDTLTQPHSPEDIKNFHAKSRIKDEKMSEDISDEHPGWAKHYSLSTPGYQNFSNSLWNHHHKTEIENSFDKKDHERGLAYSHELTKVVTKHKTPHDFTLFTGISQENADSLKLKGRKEPSKFHHPGFISTSTDYKQSLNFTGGGPKSGEENHVIKLEVPKGTQGGSIRHISSYKKENEVLLNRGHDLEIHHEPTIIDHPKGGKVHIWHAKVVGHNPQKLDTKPLHEVIPDDLKKK